MINVHAIESLKASKKKITMVTCYDFLSAKALSETSIDVLLVGDSVAMVVHGFEHTIHATIEMMSLHTSAVARGCQNKLIVSDMPFLSTRKTLSTAVDQAGALIRAGAHAVKIEGKKGHEKIIPHLVQSGIPVMGHLGLTPQSVHQLGGYKVQGRTQKTHDEIMSDSLTLQEMGCFALVLECVPLDLAAEIANRLSIPVIGIGAGVDVDGQVLVLPDLTGLNEGFHAKFVRRFDQAAVQLKLTVENYAQAVRDKTFPTEQESFK